eukprot:XP_019918337.1 PREDICTED: uncharacterized protein LOC105317290 [Crassostrea gigas]
MNTASSTYRIHKCSKCPGDTGYHCVSCPCDLCPQCKENHVKDLNTIDHDVVSHRDKINYIPTEEICVGHPSKVYVNYCEPCKLPVCFHCRKHRNHRQVDVNRAYKTKREQHRGTIHTIRSEALFYRPVLLTGIEADFKTCRTEFSLYQSEMLTKAKTLKNLINRVTKNFMYNVFCDFNFKHRCLKQKIEMSRHINSLQRYIHRYEQPEFTFSPLQFLSSIKKALTEIHLMLHTSQLSMTESLKKEDVMESLSAIQIKERGTRRVENQCLLKLMSSAEFHQSLTVTGVDCSYHISCVTSDRVWVSDRNNLILTNTKGVCLHCVEGDLFSDSGLHTLTNESELIYIDCNDDINKLAKDINTTKTFIEKTDSTWEPRCVHWSPSTGDLLVGMSRKEPKEKEDKEDRDNTADTEIITTWTGKVTRYDQSGQLTQTIQYDNTGRKLYRDPLYITENNNGDVVVSDYKAVVVTERGGRHLFSYTGHPSGSRLWPLGICTDPLSHILLCDDWTNAVQMLDQDGQFLSHLLIRPSGIFYPRSLSYDVNTHRLWVGSLYNNTVVIYRYITRQLALTATADVTESLNEIPTTGTEKPQQVNECLLKMMSPPELLHSLTVTGVDGCLHISCVTSDRVWVNDGRKKLILTDTTGVPLHRVEGSRSYICKGSHTVNSENELIYIDRKYNINKLSKDMKTTTTFIERTDSAWEPRCMHWSPSTGDLLVVMCREDFKEEEDYENTKDTDVTEDIENTADTANTEDTDDTANTEDTDDIENIEETEEIEDVEDTEDTEDVEGIEDTEDTDDTDDSDDTEDIEDIEDVEDIEDTEDTDVTEDIDEIEDIEDTEDVEEIEDAEDIKDTADTDDTEDIEDTEDTDDTEFITTSTGKVTRYDQSGRLTQTIQYDNTGRELYTEPNYITENNNGDVVVSDCYYTRSGAILVTERGGRHRFSYTGHPSGSGLEPRGICTDPLSHILVCDAKTDKVHILDKDGQFLSHLLINPLGKFGPCSLSYDVNTHHLWVGSRYNSSTVLIYRYITRQDTLTDEHTPRPDGDALITLYTRIHGGLSRALEV